MKFELIIEQVVNTWDSGLPRCRWVRFYRRCKDSMSLRKA